jgi:hypothetical protein
LQPGLWYATIPSETECHATLCVLYKQAGGWLQVAAAASADRRAQIIMTTRQEHIWMLAGLYEAVLQWKH